MAVSSPCAWSGLSSNQLELTFNQSAMHWSARLILEHTLPSIDASGAHANLLVCALALRCSAQGNYLFLPPCCKSAFGIQVMSWFRAQSIAIAWGGTWQMWSLSVFPVNPSWLDTGIESMGLFWLFPTLKPPRARLALTILALGLHFSRPNDHNPNHSPPPSHDGDYCSDNYWDPQWQKPALPLPCSAIIGLPSLQEMSDGCWHDRAVSLSAQALHVPIQGGPTWRSPPCQHLPSADPPKHPSAKGQASFPQNLWQCRASPSNLIAAQQHRTSTQVPKPHGWTHTRMGSNPLLSTHQLLQFQSRSCYSHMTPTPTNPTQLHRFAWCWSPSNTSEEIPYASFSNYLTSWRRKLLFSLTCWATGTVLWKHFSIQNYSAHFCTCSGSVQLWLHCTYFLRPGAVPGSICG